MSLYAGIFTPIVDEGEQREKRGDREEKREEQGEEASPTETHDAEKKQEQAPDLPRPAARTPQWSTALRFAPRKKTAERPKAAPSAVHLLPSFSEEHAEGTPPPGGMPRTKTVHASPRTDLHAAAHEPSAPTPMLARTDGAPERIPAPPMRLADAELEKDRARSIADAEARGDAPWQTQNVDDDVNGYYASHPKRKRKQRRAVSPVALSMNLDADYDPAIPNEYAVYIALVKDRRRRRSEWQQWAHEDEEDERPERLRKFAPPPSYGVPSSSIPMVDVDDAVGAPLGPPPVPHAPGPPPPGPPPVPPNRLAPPGPPPPRPPSMTDAPTPNVLDKKKQAAAAIAAAFSQPKRAVPAPYRPPPPDDHTPDPTKFAERLMERYGYKQGEGLGADGNKGMVRPLEARATKRGAARGTIVNRNPDEAHAQARAQFGEPSEVIVLDHVLDTEADITRDTPQEIEHGYVDRVVLHPTSSGVRALVQFTGMAGAYRTVRALDQHVFRGRPIRSKYYPAPQFAVGEYALD